MATTGSRLSNYFGERKFATGDLNAFIARYWYVILIVALLITATVLRLWSLGTRALHHDESIHVLFAYNIAHGTKYVHDPVYHGPFQYFGTAAVFKIFGDSTYTARLLPAFFGIALVGLPFFLRRQLGTLGAFVAAGILTISPVLLYFSRFGRNDIYVAFFTLAIVICIWRYMEDRKDGWLIAMAPLLALSFASKEVTFIIVAVLLVFIDILLAHELVQQWRGSRELKQSETLVAYGIAIPTAWAIAAVWSLTGEIRKRYSLTETPALVPVLIIIGTLCAAQYAAGVQKLPFIDDNGYMAEGNVMRWTTLLLILAGAYVGLLWNWRVWLTAGVIFYAVFVLLYTSFFTNMPGFWTGIWGSMDYWLGQQHVRRGDQPDYYYFMLLPVYEFLPLVFALGGALFYAFRGKLEQGLLAAAALLLITTLSFLPDDALGLIGQYRIQLAFVIAIGATLLFSIDWFTKFLLFWTLSILFGLSVAGEKMPWLTVHLSLPLALLAAKVLNDILSSVKLTSGGASGQRRISLDVNVVVPFAAMIILVSITTLLFIRFGPSSGFGILSWLLSVGALGGVVWLGANKGWRMAGQVASVGLFSALMVFTIRASGTAAYDQGDPGGVPPEMLIYAQGSADLGYIHSQIEKVAKDSGLGNDIHLVIDNSGNIWPWPWYVRHYHNVEYTNFDEGYVPPSGAIILVSTGNQSKMEPYLDQYSEGIPYTHMWWFPEFYKGLDAGQFVKDVFNGDLISTWRQYFIDRTVNNATETPNMIAYFPKEYESSVSPPTSSGIRDKAPSLPEGSYDVIATLGTNVGQVSQPADVAVDAAGNVYVVDTLNQRIQIFAPDGTAKAFGEEGTGPGQFANPAKEVEGYDANDGPWGIAVAPDGSIYVADTWNHRIQRFTPDGQVDPSFNIGGLFGPRDITVAPDGSLIVVDTGNKHLSIFDENGNLQKVVGQEGSGRGEFNEPSSISISANGSIYAADYWNKRIQRFDSEFQYSGEFDVKSWGSPGITDRAYIAALSDGTVLATDPANGAIIVFDSDGKEIGAWSLPGLQTRPIGITVDDAEENVYITDGFASQVVKVPLAVLLGPPPSAASTP